MRRIGVPEYLGSVPWMLGYQPDDGQVVVLVQSERGNMLASMDAQTAHVFDRAAAADLISRADQGLAPGPKQIVVAGFGASGPASLGPVSDALRALSTDQSVVDAHVTAERYTLRDHAGVWSEPAALPAPDISLLVSGRAPAPSRQARAETFAPLPQPLFQPADAATRAQLARLAPTDRVLRGREVLERMAQPGAPRTATDLAVFAEVVADDVLAVRDHLIVSSARRPEHLDVLVRTYRGAPPELRDRVGAAAAAALLLSGNSTLESRTVLDHLNERNSLAELVAQVAEHPGTNPRDLLERIESTAGSSLRAADDRHAQAQSAKLRGYTAAPGDRGTTAGQDKTRRTGGEPGGPQIER
ncbi:MAG: hypothetical protein ACTHXC_10985 [Brachybacterium sp.]